jgi:hypothetical protein
MLISMLTGTSTMVGFFQAISGLLTKRGTIAAGGEGDDWWAATHSMAAIGFAYSAGSA